MKIESILDRNHVIGLLIGAITLGGFIFLPSNNILQSIYLNNSGATLLGLLSILYFMRSIIAIPLSPITVFIGYHYGFPKGIVIGLSGSTLSCFIPYLIGRYIRTQDGIIGFILYHSEKIVDVTGTVRGVLAARISPLPTDAISYGAGLTDVPLTDYLIGTIIGLLPWTVTLVLFGDSLQDLVLDNIRLEPQLLISMALIGFLLILPSLYKWSKENIDN
jgi:uncharacterized membrane protein YdjX (TVP38/TMEM64 family)